MTILRVIFSNKDPLLMYHMLKGGGDFIAYSTVLEYTEYLDVYESIKEQGEKEVREKHEKQMQENKSKR